RVATPMGRHQIVGSTLRHAVQKGWVQPDEQFSPKVQDRIAVNLAREALSGKQSKEAKREALRGVWEGFQSVDNASLDRAIEQFERGEFAGLAGDARQTAQARGLAAAAATPPKPPEIEPRRYVDEMWRDNEDGTETLMLRPQGSRTYVPSKDLETGDPITRQKGKEEDTRPSLSSGMESRIERILKQNADEQGIGEVDPIVLVSFREKALELLAEGKTEDEAFNVMLRLAEREGREERVPNTGFMGMGRDKRTVNDGQFTGGFGLGEAAGATPPQTTQPAQAPQAQPQQPQKPNTGILKFDNPDALVEAIRKGEVKAGDVVEDQNGKRVTLSQRAVNTILR
ncbi:MAG: hypothetical protein AAFU56_11510, partial [Pseudomonadota bacterium]